MKSATTFCLVKQSLCALLLLLTLACPVAAGEPGTVGGYPPEEALRLGAAMYRQGMLPSGQPLRATVQGDIELDGTMSTCMNCHLRSGLGSLEGGVLSPPTNGAKLYVPLQGPADIPGSVMKRSMFKGGRPAYTRETLARLLRSGIGPDGVPALQTMPVYQLTDAEMEIMIYYLEQLSRDISPGVSAEEIRFATVVSDRTPPQEREAFLAALNAFVREEWNGRIAGQKALQSVRRARTEQLARNYRPLTLEVWELKGAPESWEGQLEALYRAQPVFAVLGGTTPGKWDPVHRFCEKNQIPCILPATQLPLVSASDWYTLYFSKGYHQEGDTAAKYLSRVFTLPPGQKLVQLYRADSEEGKALSRGFAGTWSGLGEAALIDRPVAAAEKIDARFWQRLASSHPDAVFLLWLGPADLAGVETLAALPGRPSTIFLSAGMLSGDFKAVPEAIRELTLITHPTRLPGDGDYARSIFANWLKLKRISVADQEAAWRGYMITRLLSRVLNDMGEELYRDYFLDLFDDGKDETNTSVLYPKLSFGPGQRYASKGCYVVSLTKGNNVKVVRQSDWVVY